MTLGTGETARLFFAAWPAPSVQDALHDVAQRFQRESGGRVVAARNIHLTLAFLGDVRRYRLPQIEAAAARLSGSSYELVIDRVEYWRHNRILWAAVECCPDSLCELVAGLSSELRGLGFTSEDRPYVPHITLLRNARSRPANSMIASITWPVHDLALIESVPDGGQRVYKVLHRWPLTHV